MRKIVYLLLLAICFSSCSVYTLTHYSTTVDKIIKLKPGINKQKVIDQLGVYPYDILSSHQDGCEIHVYKYKYLHRKYLPHEKTTETGLTSGRKRFQGEGTLFVIYRDNKLASFYTEVGKQDSFELIYRNNEVTIACDNSEYTLIPEDEIEEEEEETCSTCEMLEAIISKGGGSVEFNINSNVDRRNLFKRKKGVNKVDMMIKPEIVNEKIEEEEEKGKKNKKRNK